ncbi:MAG: pseudouridylate synthase [Oceanicaulis sp.]|mgnify:CR=1 FL=1|uniref:pseudouridine synthase n=1 Tax=unclassified Oceanicaulis TaxID=2632123 RepID=UPI000C52C9DD|nr:MULTISPECIES: pseudouridine synthase [unclassified Oceanicaulis]MAB69781.1 pseudouridylate synthase [Oceanicaulis sp.]MBC39957.1 pseudouridylate synthase [Oceanicaulis sp.]MBG35870.1 pseudouridylate synthase [Oceanicaulis sp.]HBU63200.1 rRNA pseudouridine synthase [Oceanicaulis sp.]
MTDTPSTPDTPEEEGGERIAKVLAHAGIASRREAERLIEKGRVSVNGEILRTPAFKVMAGDDVRVDGESIGQRPPTRVWRYHKPVGLLTTHSDPQGRDTVFQTLPQDMGRVISVGRLDLNSEGLLLLTNDGELARVLELPSTGWTRRYRVRAYGNASDKALAELENGTVVDGVVYGPVEVTVDRRTGANVWLTVGIKEGKNREVRKVLQSVGLTVNRLMRVAYGPFQLGSLKRGEISESKLSVLRDQLGKLYPLDTDGLPLKPGETAKPDTRTGTAKAKPKANRPHQKSGGKPRAGLDADSIMPAGGKSKTAKGWAKAKPKANEKPKSSKRSDPKGSGGKKAEGRKDADRRRRS